VTIPLAIAEAARAAARPARAVSDDAAVTAGVEAALAADRRCWARLLLSRLSELPSSATAERELFSALAEELSAAADEVDNGMGQVAYGWALPNLTGKTV
jgi:hypothetical protein